MRPTVVALFAALTLTVAPAAGALAAVPAVASMSAAGSASAAPAAPPEASTRSAATAPAPPAPRACPSCWKPPVHTTWHLVLRNVPRAPYRAVAMYDVDGFESTAATVSSLHAAGIKATCYLSAGSWEDFRPDAGDYPVALIGASNGWPGENWVDIRDVQKPGSKLRAILDRRLTMCHNKGFDVVDLDNVDGYLNVTGFPLSAADQLYFNAVLANDAHARGMSVLQKNDNEQIPQLIRYFDGAVNEQCNQYRECTTAQNGGAFGLDQYVAAGKPVFQVEYRLTTGQFCAADNRNSFNGVRLNLALNDRTFQPCW